MWQARELGKEKNDLVQMAQTDERAKGLTHFPAPQAGLCVEAFLCLCMKTESSLASGWTWLCLPGQATQRPPQNSTLWKLCLSGWSLSARGLF